MLWIALFPIAVLVIAIHDNVRDPWIWHHGDWGMIAIGSVLCGLLMFLAALAGAGLAALIGCAFKAHAVERRRRTLVAIRDKDGVSGRFFLGSGFVEGDPYYFYYEQLQDGGLKPGKVKVGDGVRIYEEERDDAELVEFEWVVDRDLAYLIAVPTNEGGYSYDFHVPKGTVRAGFTM